MWFFPPAAGEKFFGGVFTFELNPPPCYSPFWNKGGFNSSRPSLKAKILRILPFEIPISLRKIVF